MSTLLLLISACDTKLIHFLARSYPNEIVEFPVVLLQWRRLTTAAEEGDYSTVPTAGEEELDMWTLEIVDEFQSFVRPTWKPKLSAFCTELTGITQVGLATPDLWTDHEC